MHLTPSDITRLESIDPSAFAAILRGDDKKKKKTKKDAEPKESNRIMESAAIVTSTDAVVDPDNKQNFLAGPVVKVVLITEGLGNMRDKNYYGREAIESGALIFEGSVMMQDHLSYMEEQDIPEGRVGKTVAYYKNCKAEMIDTSEGKKFGVTAEAHFDLSQEGLNAFQKAKTAVHYRDEFPQADREYVGISVNAIGESEPRKMTVNGQDMEVNYVTRFAEGSRGADMVTLPARGGSFRALVEDIYGAKPNKEAKMKKLLKALESAKTQFTEAMAEKDAALRLKKTTEAQAALDASIAAIKEAAKLTPNGEADDVTESGHNADNPDCECADCKVSESKSEDDVDPKDKKTEAQRKAAKVATARQEADRKEMQTVALEKLIEATGIDKKHFDMPSLLAVSFREAKADIAKQKRMHEAAVATVLAKIGPDVRASHRVRESGTTEGQDTGGSENNAEFPLLSVAE